MDGGEVPRLAGFRLEVERVKVVDLLEGEYTGKGEQEVKSEDEDVI